MAETSAKNVENTAVSSDPSTSKTTKSSDVVNTSDTTANVEAIPERQELPKENDPIGRLFTLIIQALITTIDAFVEVIQQNAQVLAELTIVGGLIYGALKLAGRSLSGVMGVVRA